MRYPQTREQSAELLRVVLAHMARHEATFNPLTYAVWYEYVAGTNGRLKAALDRCLGTTPRLDDETIARLYAEHVAEPDGPALQHASGELQRLMSGMAASAESTGSQAGVFGARLVGLSTALRGGDVASLGPMIDGAIAGTADMKDTVVALRQQIASGREEIARLRGDLNRAQDEALIDPLTQSLNRKGFDLELQRMLQQPLQPFRAHGLVMLDIDHFKVVNDSHGHVMGDRVLQVVGQALQVGAPPQVRVARYGGEEFAALWPQSTLDATRAEAEAMRQRIKAIRVRDRRSKDVVLTITLSAGVAVWRPGEDAASLIARADRALYEAKQGGRDRVCAA